MAKKVDFTGYHISSTTGGGHFAFLVKDGNSYKFSTDKDPSKGTDTFIWVNGVKKTSFTEDELLDFVNNHYGNIVSTSGSCENVVANCDATRPNIKMSDLIGAAEKIDPSTVTTYWITGKDEETDKLALNAISQDNGGEKDQDKLEKLLKNSVEVNGDNYSIGSDGSLIVENTKDPDNTSKKIYNSDGKMTQKSETVNNKTAGTISTTTSIYDPDTNKQTKETTTVKKGTVVIEETEKEFDGANTKNIKYTKRNESSGKKEIEKTTECDSAGKPKQVETITYDTHEQEATKETIVYNGDKATKTKVVHNSDGTITTTTYESTINPSTGEYDESAEKQVGDPVTTTPATADDQAAVAATISDADFENSLTPDEKTQLQAEIEAYMKKYGVDETTAKKACLAALKAKKYPKNNKSIFDGSDENHPKLDKYLNPEPYMDSKLTQIKDLLVSTSADAVKKTTAFKEFLRDKLKNGPFLSNALTQLSGESAAAYRRLLEDLNIKVDILTSNAEIAEKAMKLIDEELVPALVGLAAIDAERQTLAGELTTYNNEYNDLLNNEPTNKEEEVIEYNTPGDATSGEKSRTTVPTKEYTDWLGKVEEAERKINELLYSRPISISGVTPAISVTGLVALDAAGAKLKEKCYKILGENTDLEGLIKEFGDAYKDEDEGDGKKKKPGGRNPGGGDPPSGGGGDPPTEAPELPDNTQDQMKYYQELAMSELSDIAENLAKFAETNKLTIQALLFDEKNAEKLVEYLSTLGVLDEGLRKLIKEGNILKTQELLRDIFIGKQESIVGLDSLTKEVIVNKLNDIAATNNTTISNLLSNESNANLIRAELNDKDIINNLKSISRENMKSQLSNIYDGDGVDNYKSKTLKTLKDYMDKASEKNNMSIEDYLESDKSLSNIDNLGKTTVFLNTISGFDDKTLIEVLRTVLT